MYLQGIITIDPSQLTHLDRVKPTKAFARIAHTLTAGLVASQEERETFCAVTILQQINVVMRSLGVDNIVRLAKDDTVIFEDTEGKEGDLKQAFDSFSSKVKPDDAKLFETLELLLEHYSADQTYLIDIRINRTHHVGEHPIQITLNGLPNELAGEVGKEYDRGPLDRVFTSQQSYDDFTTRHKNLFLNFLNDIESAFKRHMKVDKVRATSRVKIIRPSKRVNEPADVPHLSNNHYDPLYEDHYGFGETFFFAWLWSDLCHANDIQCHDCTLVDSSGADVLAVSAQGFQAGEGNTMNVDEPFTPPASAGVQIMGDNEYSTEIAGDSTGFFSGFGGGDSESRGWLSSLSDSIGSMGESLGESLGSLGDSIGGDGGGSSCGGGCGGCGGG
jgi:hypothetical protein